jgi:hypothetical protein
MVHARLPPQALQHLILGTSSRAAAVFFAMEHELIH